MGQLQNNLSQKQNNSKNKSQEIWTWGKFLQEAKLAFGDFVTTETQNTEQPEHTKTFETTFWRKPKPSQEKFQQICKNCDHPKIDHYAVVLDPTDNPKAKSSNCRRDSCVCKKFILELE